MKTVILASMIAILASQAHAQSSGHESGGSTPFGVSGDKIGAIFKSPKLWQRLGGAVETISLRSQTNKSSQYLVSTTEYKPVLDAYGVTIGSKKIPCSVLVEVSDNSRSGLAPNWQVSRVNFNGCQK